MEQDQDRDKEHASTGNRTGLWGWWGESWDMVLAGTHRAMEE